MWMTKEEFQTKIEAGKTINYGCTSFYKDERYYYSCLIVNACGEGTESFESFEELWDEVSHYFLHGVDYSGSRGSKKVDNLPALDYDPQQFNPMCRYGESTIANYYGPGQDLEIRYDPHPRVVTIDQLTIKHKKKETEQCTLALSV